MINEAECLMFKARAKGKVVSIAGQAAGNRNDMTIHDSLNSPITIK